MTNYEKKHIPEIRFKGFSNNWNIKKIKDIFNITRGYVLPTASIQKNKDNNFIYPVFSSQTLNNGLLGFYNNFLYENALTWTTDGANAGTVKFRKEKFYCTNVCGVLLEKDEVPNTCISYALNNIAYKYVSKVGNPKLMNNVMAEINIIIPQKNEQYKIGNYFHNIDEIIVKITNKLLLIEKYKKRLLNDLLFLFNNRCTKGNIWHKMSIHYI